MPQKLGYIALVVRDYDEAIAFYTTKLGFHLIEDTDLGNGKRWVAPKGCLEPGKTAAEIALQDETVSCAVKQGTPVLQLEHTIG